MSRRQIAFGLTMTAVALLLALRLPHLVGPLDDPHSWRQCDTATYTREFTRHGIDLLRPAVTWLGPHRTLVFEFPLPEGIAAVLANAAGSADPFWDRVVTLGFFLISAAYFYALAVRLCGGGTAPPIALLAYLVSPLAQFYSRAANVDFAAQAFAHAFLWHALAALDRRSVPQALAATATGALAALIKSPYVAPVVFPLALAAFASGAAAAWALAALALLGPAVAFVAWRRWVDSINGQVPDWTFLPGFYKEVNPLWWYIGDWSERLQVGAWVKLVRRLVREVAGLALVPLLLTGLLPVRGGRARPGPVAFALAWLAGTFVYLLTFFPLNVIHNYYQVPFVAPFALLIGLGGARFFSIPIRLGPVPVGALAVVAGLALTVPVPRQLGWYRVDHLREEGGDAVRVLTKADELLVAVDPSSMFSDPRLLYRADRFGWPLAAADATRDRLERLRAEGADRLVWLENADGSPPLPAWLRAVPATEATIRHRDDALLGTVHMWRLETLLAAPAEAPGP